MEQFWATTKPPYRIRWSGPSTPKTLHSGTIEYRIRFGTIEEIRAIQVRINTPNRQESQVALSRILYDISKAFDRPTKGFIKLCWHRIGVPDDIARWLVDLDIGGRSYIKSPWAQHGLDWQVGDSSHMQSRARGPFWHWVDSHHVVYHPGRVWGGRRRLWYLHFSSFEPLVSRRRFCKGADPRHIKI